MASSGSFQTSKCKNLSLLISWSVKSQSIENNSSTISWSISGYRTDGATGYITCGGFKLVINGTTVYSKSEDYRVDVRNGDVIASGDTTISHNSDGTKTFSASAEAGIYYWAVNCSGSDSFTLPTIPRKSTLSVANGTLGTEQTIKVTRQATTFTHSIKAVCGSSTLYIKADGSTSTSEVKHSDCSIPFTPPISWASQNTTGTSVSVKFTLTTYNGSTNVGNNAYTKTYTIPATVAPSCSIAVSDPTGYKDTYGVYLKGLSKFKVVVTGTPNQGSAIASYKSTANGTVYTKSSFTTAVLVSSGTLTVKSTVTDKRGRTGTASKDLTVLNYTKPSITALSVHRCNKDGTPNDVDGDYVKFVFSSSVTSLTNTDKANTATYKLEYKKTTETTYTTVNLTAYENNYAVSDGTDIFEADSGSSYNVRVIVTDNFNSGAKATTASTGFTIMHWLASGLGMAIGKVSELANVLDIGFKTRFMGGILHPVLEPETDLNDVLTPNTYVGANVSTYNYANCPLTSGTFSLEVIGMGEDGQVKQRLTYCHKTLAKAWERIYYGEAWGEWVCVSDFDGQLLWQGVLYMAARDVANLSEPISKQRSGIVLVFSRYSSSTAQDYHFQTFFVPKYQIAKHTGCGHTFMLTTDATFSLFAAKYLYINDASIAGNDNNEASGTGTCGITYTNNGFVLRYVIGV